MSMGAERAEAQDDVELGVVEPGWNEPEQTEDAQWHPPEPIEPPGGPRLLAGLLIAAALAWIGVSAWAIAATAPAATLPVILQWIAIASAPLILIGLVWMMFGRTRRHETERFTRAVIAMRGESAALESILSIVATRLEENHARLTSEAAKLMSLGDEASDRLGRVTHYLSRESATLDRKAEALEAAAANARVDIGVLLHDLPRAEEQARLVAEAMKQAGLTAHEQAGALEGQLSALAARGREADEVVGGAAQRLAAHLARIESTSTAAAGRMDDAANSMSIAIDTTMARAAEAVDEARAGIEAQSAATMAMIERSRAALEKAGEEAGRNLAQRLETIGGKIESLAAHLAAQDAASHALVTGLARELTELDEKFAKLSEAGTSGADRLTQSLNVVRACVKELFLELSGGHDRAADLIDRAHDMAKALANITEQLQGDVPAALTQVEEQAGRVQATASSILPSVEAIQASADAAAARIGGAEASVERQREALDVLLARLSEGVSGAEAQLKALGSAAAEADADARRIVGETGPALVEALVRVREAANQAADRAREAIASVIPDNAAALGEASRKAMEEALAGPVEARMKEVGEAAARAVETARQASERLTRQMLTIAETTAAVEQRIEEGRQEREGKENENMSRRVALLIESLNSTAIDVTKILSNDVTDTAWAAYLRGDRGVFTRRAVRLLDSGEARTVAQHYEAEPEFRDQVNRYIHDFEAMLRRILADRDGSPLGVTLLSSDMGKLYVALAQAIERLRT